MHKIDKIIIHCTATKAGQHVTVSDVDRWHKARGFRGIGYHFLIYLDGTVARGRGIGEAGAHTKGYNANSVGVCYVGGLDSAGNPADTRTSAQRDALHGLVARLLKCYPGASVHGHREFANKACPCFDVKAEKW